MKKVGALCLMLMVPGWHRTGWKMPVLYNAITPRYQSSTIAFAEPDHENSRKLGPIVSHH